MTTLSHISVENFKSIRHLELDLKPLNILIGANGAGKSNFIGVFTFLNELLDGNLQVYTGKSGGANSILYFGRKTSARLSFTLSFDGGANGYQCSLVPTEEDRFIFQEEHTWFHEQNNTRFSQQFGKGHSESGLPKTSDTPGTFGQYMSRNLRSWKLYHFHDTSDSAAIKQTVDIDDNRFFRPDGGNLAAFLYLLSKQYPGQYKNIQDSIRLVAPFFDRFVLEPLRRYPDKIRLEWKHKGTSDYFNASSLSDGTLRFMCLATLLLQPDLPSIILLDEPELGLHPTAVVILASLLRSASKKSPVIVATQSVTLVNQFAPEDIVVVGRDEEQSVFRYLDSSHIAQWLEEYTLGDLWEKNILGGRP